MKYEQYLDYEYSGIEWLGNVPKHWVTSRLAYTFTDNNAGEVIDKTFWGDGSEVLYTCNKTSLKSDYSTFPQQKRTSDRDLLLTRNGTPYVHLPVKNAIYSNVVQRITLATGFDRRYLAFCLGNSALYLKGYGVSIESFNFDMWKSLSFSYPELEDQRIIVNFLDHETAKIDTLIDKQQQLIKLLKEKRQAVISHAVTKGLNPDVPMKDSGVEWLGEVPEHWDLKAIKYCVDSDSGIQMGPFGGMLKSLEANPTGYKVFGQENTISGDFSKGSRWITAKRYSELENYHLSVGEIVLTRKGSLGNARLISQLNTKGIIDSDTIRVRVDQRTIMPGLLAFLLHSSSYVEEQITRNRRGAILSGLNSETVANLKLLVPPIAEQRRLMTCLADIEQHFDEVLQKANLAIDLLTEKRIALISAAVTGKIDVRNFKAGDTYAA
ncbi:restriction endonuclease subunit S [Amphritea sp. 1_MG-2023]|uniref:restriction endonuclease subunit S n=1 Tax=Amphritea sp. 1_MG-2023 TaxID=3062670 RepID=UPI0026E11897|nr:restriction endonuclease subunit S [Amphritea sp. 1_MG-2023]MDO6564634.1 restriction endonuclease subunit S [Amphritea sp. 1_MG-2023]